MTKRNRKTIEANMTQALAPTEPGVGELDLDSLIAGLNAADEPTDDTEVIEPVSVEAADDTDAIIESAMEAAAEVLDREEMYAEQSNALTAETVSEGDKPKSDADKVIAKATKEKKKREKKAKPEGEAAAKTTEPKAPAEPKPPRVTFSGNRRSAVLDYRTGGRGQEFLALELTDVELDADALAAKQAELRDQLDNVIAKKVAEKAIMLFRDLSAGTAIKNEVMATTFKVLKRDGFITSGDKGNVQVALREKYSLGTARSQANQMFMLFPFLKLTLKGEKSQQVPNPQSALLPLINDSLGLL